MVSQFSQAARPAKHTNVQPIATPELPSAVPLMALSTGFWAFKTLAAATSWTSSAASRAARARLPASWRKRSVYIHARPRCC